jgi:hypothetical protein
VSSYFFDDPILGWAANETQKIDLKLIKTYGHYKAPISGPINTLIIIE